MPAEAIADTRGVPCGMNTKGDRAEIPYPSRQIAVAWRRHESEAMTVQQNTDHIQTTHIGSLPRPHKLLDLLKAKYSGQGYDEQEFNSVLAQAVRDCVRKQVECGIEIVTDGEFSKPGFFTYIQERLEGFEARPGQKLVLFQQEVAAFPEYYAQYFKDAMMGGTIIPIVPLVCVGPVTYSRQAALER